MALTEFEDGLCGGCGQPRDRSWNGDLEGFYEAHRATCLGCEAARLNVDEHGEPKGSTTVYITEHPDAPAEPDPRQMAKD